MKSTCTPNRLVAALACVVAIIGGTVAQAANKPNIVFILADNLGCGEIGWYGGGLTRGAATPRIDSNARSGLWPLNMNMKTRIEVRRLCLPQTFLQY